MNDELIWNDINKDFNYNNSEFRMRFPKVYYAMNLKVNSPINKNIISLNDSNKEIIHKNSYFKNGNKLANTTKIKNSLDEMNKIPMKFDKSQNNIPLSNTISFNYSLSNRINLNKYNNIINNSYLNYSRLNNSAKILNIKGQTKMKSLVQIHNKMILKNPNFSLIKKMTGYKIKNENKKNYYNSERNQINNKYINKNINSIKIKKPNYTTYSINDYYNINNKSNQVENINNDNIVNNENYILLKNKSKLNNNYLLKNQNDNNLKKSKYLNKTNSTKNKNLYNFISKSSNYLNANNINNNKINNNNNFDIIINNKQDDSSDELSEIAEELLETIDKKNRLNSPKYYRTPDQVNKAIDQLNQNNNFSLNKFKNSIISKIDGSDKVYKTRNNILENKRTIDLKNYTNSKKEDKDNDKENDLLNLNNDIIYFSPYWNKRNRKSINEEIKDNFKDLIKSGKDMFNSENISSDNVYIKKKLNKVINHNIKVDNNKTNKDSFQNQNKNEIINNIDSLNIMNSLIIINKNDEANINKINSAKNHFIKISEIDKKIKNEKSKKDFKNLNKFKSPLIKSSNFSNEIEEKNLNKLNDQKNKKNNNSLIKQIINKKEKQKSKKERHIKFNLENNLYFHYNQKSSLFDYYEIYNNNNELLPLKDSKFYLNAYMKLIKNAKDIIPCIKKFNKNEIKINEKYRNVENFEEKDIIPDLYEEDDEDIKSLEKSLENSIDKSFDKNYEKVFSQYYIDKDNNVSLKDLSSSSLNKSKNRSDINQKKNIKQLYEVYIPEVDEEYEENEK